MTTTQQEITNVTVNPPALTTVPTLQLPTRTTLPMPSPIIVVIGGKSIQTATTASTPSNTSGQNGIPLPLLTVAAIQTPVKQQSYTNCNVTVSWTRNNQDQNFDHVNVWFVGYHGSTNPQLMSAGTTSPLNFICDATKETVQVFAQTVNALGESAPLQYAASCSVTLSGIVGAPPAPTISQALIGTPTGFQFGFNQVVLPAGDQEVIANYNIYRSTTNTFSTAALRETMTPNPALSGAITFVDTELSSTGANFYYWVTAVNTAGFESAATPAAAAAVTGSIGSIPPTLNNGFTYTSTTTSITWSWTGQVISRANNTTTAVANGSQGITGLSSGTTYYFYPYYNEVTEAVAWVTAGGAGSPAYAYTSRANVQTQLQSLTQFVNLSTGPMSAATPSSGSGGGSGGGSGTCLRSDMLVHSREFGIVRVETVIVGDYLACPEGWTQVVSRKTQPQTVFIEIVTAYSGSLIVTPTHTLTRGNGDEVEAQKLTLLDMVRTRDGADTITSINLIRGDFEKILLTCEPTPRFFAGAIAPTILAHNIPPLC